MYVPPYVPQPIEIEGNVAQESYLVRLGFVRRVVFAHFATLGIATALSAQPSLPRLDVLSAAIFLLASLALLSLVRRMAKGRRADQRLSLALLPLPVFSLALLIRALNEEGWAVWVVGAGAVCVLLYASLCGRDLSFVGMFVMPLAASLAVAATAGYFLRVPVGPLLAGMALNSAYLFYFVYDLAALLTRRRLGEEWGAVADLYRDVLNGVSYPIQVYRHWRDHRIWIPPKEWFR